MKVLIEETIRKLNPTWRQASALRRCSSTSSFIFGSLEGALQSANGRYEGEIAMKMYVDEVFLRVLYFSTLNTKHDRDSILIR
jgi:hypothetical protein